MTGSIVDRLCDGEYVRARDTHLARLMDIYAGKPATKPFYISGVIGTSSADAYRTPELWVSECLASLAEQVEVLRDTETFRPLVVQCDLYGVHFIDRIFGARVYTCDQDWWADTLHTPVGQLEPPDLERDQTWLLARTIAEAFISSKVTLPLFSLPTIASALNIAVNLYNDEFLVALLTKPDAARHDLEVINEVLCKLHRWYLEHIPLSQLQPVLAIRRCQPPGYGQLCGCSTHLVSATVYRELIAPLDNVLLSTYENGGMIHLCGVHTQHIPVWREMPALRAIQLNGRASEDLEVYFRELRNDQIIYLRPSAAMTVERALKITGGHRLVIMAQAAVRRPQAIR